MKIVTFLWLLVGGIVGMAIGGSDDDRHQIHSIDGGGGAENIYNDGKQTFSTSSSSIPWDVESVTSSTAPTLTSSTITKVKSNSTGKKQRCPPSELDKCFTKMPPVLDLGIPASPAAVHTACKAFDVGMNCVEDWAKMCLGKAGREKMRMSVRGAHETFAFLCHDQKFRSEFLKHSDCYKRISHLWDECSRQFIENLRKFDHRENSTTLCCVRIQFLQCVTEIAHLHCTDEAARFLQRMAETLVRATMRSHAPTQCVNISHRNCSMVSGAAEMVPSFFCHFPVIARNSPNLAQTTLAALTQFFFRWYYH